MTSLAFRPARVDDLPFIIGLLAADAVVNAGDSAARAHEPAYRAALAAINADPNQHLLVAWDQEAPVGTLQITFTPGLARRGAWRATIESVHVVPERRGEGVGAAMMAHGAALARARGCALVQLTSNKARTRAHRFYERLGYARSHEGFKLSL